MKVPSPGLSDLAIVLVAAGTSRRMGFDKVWTDLGGQPLLLHTLARLRAVGAAELVVVVSSERLGSARSLLNQTQVVAGGARRRDSVAAGVAACRAPWLAVHDAARVMVAPELFLLGLRAAHATGAAVPVVPLNDTIKQLGEGGMVVGTLDRATHAAVQTPQVFRRDLLERALRTSNRDATDEASLVEDLGVAVATYPGREDNLKITTPVDMALLRVLMEARASSASIL